MSSSDNAFIPRVANAGQISDGFQTMHNGLKVRVGSYYGSGPVELIERNRGVHEPQEERVFQEVLKVIPPGGTMIELGAYWAFYSMWFCKEVANANAFMVEPAQENLEFGKENFRSNGFQGSFTRAYAGSAAGHAPDGVESISVDDFMAQHRISHIDILHSDIQGFELEMLKGAQRAMEERRISFLFISTHSDSLHVDCEQHLSSRGFIIITSVPPTESYSVDGVLVARAAHAPFVSPITVSRYRAGSAGDSSAKPE